MKRLMFIFAFAFITLAGFSHNNAYACDCGCGHAKMEKPSSKKYSEAGKKCGCAKKAKKSCGCSDKAKIHKKEDKPCVKCAESEKAWKAKKSKDIFFNE